MNRWNMNEFTIKQNDIRYMAISFLHRSGKFLKMQIFDLDVWGSFIGKRTATGHFDSIV